MFGRMNGRGMEKVMRSLGIRSEAMEHVEEVVFHTADKELLVKHPTVQKISIPGGGVCFQVMGQVEEICRQDNRFSEEDVRIIVEKTGCTTEEAKKALLSAGDLAGAILQLKKDGA